MNLADFLLARIAEDEAGSSGPSIIGRVVPAPVHEQTGRTVRDVVQDMDLWHARVLAECEAKRRIVDLHAVSFREHPSQYVEGVEIAACVECSPDDDQFLWVEFPCKTLRLLALPYADHPDYREEWRP